VINLTYVRDDTLDLRAAEDGAGEYTETLAAAAREASPELTPVPLKRKPVKPSKHSLFVDSVDFRPSYPTLPRELIRNLAQQFTSRQITKDAIPYLEKATDEFFKYLRFTPKLISLSHHILRTDVCSSDLAAFARHAGKKLIDEGDVQMLLQRYVL